MLTPVGNPHDRHAKTAFAGRRDLPNLADAKICTLGSLKLLQLSNLWHLHPMLHDRVPAIEVGAVVSQISAAHQHRV
ncbi:MAG: hypothetical protein WCO86_02260 [Planctomycetota bacterium]